MRSCIRKSVRCLLLLIILCVAQPAVACPMCKVANEDSIDPVAQAQPRAYFYSILFMLAMPATIVSSLSYSLYRMTRMEEEAATRYSDMPNSDENP